MRTATKPAAIPTRTALDDGRPEAGERTRTTGCVLVVAQHTLLGAGLRAALTQLGWVAETLDDTVDCDVADHVTRLDASCVLLEVHLGGATDDTIELIKTIDTTGAKVVVLTAERRRTVLAEWLEAGAAGWISKSADLDEVDVTLARAVDGEDIVGRTERSELLEHLRVERIRLIRTTARFGELTPREALVLAALADGLSADEIAEQHFVALTTVRSQIRAVLQKLGVNSQLAAVAIADRHRWLLPSDGQSDRDRRSHHRGPSASSTMLRE